jgi:hypothetical protein
MDLLSPKSYSSSSFPLLPDKIEPPRSGGVSFSTPDGSGLFAFGGYAEWLAIGDSIPERYVVNDLWQFIPHPMRSEFPYGESSSSLSSSSSSSSSSSWGWTEVSQNGDDREDGALRYVPPSRLATALAVLPNSDERGARAVLLGGWDPQTPGTGGVILDDVSMLDVVALEWSRCVGDANDDRDGEGGERFATIPDGPTSRHVVARLSIRRDGNDEREDVICLHNHRCDDHVLLLSTTGRNAVNWNRVATTGNAPPSRGLHCAATIRRSRAMVVFGGAAKDGNMSNEAFVLDADTWEWTKLDCGGGGDGDVVPVPRAGACLCPLDNDSVLLFGGAAPGDGGLMGLNDVWVLNVDVESGKGSWDCLIPHRTPNDAGGDDDKLRPPGRNAAQLVPIDVDVLLPKDIVWKSGSSADDNVECHYFLLNVSHRAFAVVGILQIFCQSRNNSMGPSF